MRIDGGWYLFDDEVERPIILGVVLARNGNWAPTLFLVDTGADCTVLNASACAKLGFESSDQRERLGGLAEAISSAKFPCRLVADRGISHRAERFA